MRATLGLREFKKQRTRQAIAEAAMELFVKRGFEHVTVAEVAEAVGVSEKTVFNYFPTKEDLFFDEFEAQEAALIAAIRDRKAGESILEALHRHQVSHCRRMCSPGFAHFARVIEESPALRAKELELLARMTRTLAEALERELGLREVDAGVAAGLLVSVHWHLFVTARKRALVGPHGPAAERRLLTDLQRAYVMLEHGLGELGTK